MNEQEETEYLIEYFKNSLNKFDYYNKDNYQNFFLLLKKIDFFIGKYNNANEFFAKDDYLNLLNIILSKTGSYYKNFKGKLENIDNLFSYEKMVIKITNLFANGQIEKKDLKITDELFSNPKYLQFFNLNEKFQRLVEDKLFRNLNINSLGEKLITECITGNTKINYSLAVYMALKFYRNTKHPAQIVTFFVSSTYSGFYSKEDGNINLNFQRFDYHSNVSFKSKNKKDFIEKYNMELLLLVLHECVHFQMMYNNQDYYYESQLCNIAAFYDTEEIHDFFYLEHEAEIRAHQLLIDLLNTNLKNLKSEFLIDKLNKSMEEINTKYYGIKNGVRTKNPHEEIYYLMENVIMNSTNNNASKNKSITALKFNKYKQEYNAKVFDAYELSDEEVKKILLVIILEYTKGNTYSRFNMDVAKDIAIHHIDDLVAKYKHKEYQKNLQSLFLEINQKNNYDDKLINNTIMSLPMNYYLINKINYLKGNDLLEIDSKRSM